MNAATREDHLLAEVDRLTRLLAAVQGLLAAVESEGQHFVPIEAVRAAISPERDTT